MCDSAASVVIHALGLRHPVKFVPNEWRSVMEQTESSVYQNFLKQSFRRLFKKVLRVTDTLNTVMAWYAKKHGHGLKNLSRYFDEYPRGALEIAMFHSSELYNCRPGCEVPLFSEYETLTIGRNVMSEIVDTNIMLTHPHPCTDASKQAFWTVYGITKFDEEAEAITDVESPSKALEIAEYLERTFSVKLIHQRDLPFR